ncbi:unnamed protein product [Prorocentrum cordatum]|uniref:Reverse transcriptase Ty1/copia-type domain-containing protein n=1 Tax=Prorocentrum cordatum TaxID=2364126 RepID=A0ABN9Q2Q3_9DINO|nr:unnamed protein product [Polarella glacialis]
MDQEALFVKVRNRQRSAFLSWRTDTTKKQVTPKKGREIRSIPQEWKAAFDASDLEEWRKWVEYDAVDWPTEEELAGVDKPAILPMRRVRTDKNEATRGNLSCEQHPLKLQTNAPALTDTATSVILQEAASQSGWRLEQGDVDLAFLNGKYLDNSRRVYFRAPKGGLPAVPEMGWPAVPEGAVLRAKKGIYGLNDAPLLWYEEHRDTMLSLPRASRSKLRPALFIFHDENEKLIGLIGTHVDDDLVAGSPEFFANQVTKLRKMHCYGKWQTAKTGFHHCGRFLKQRDDGTITCSRREYTESIEKIPISNERRKDKEAKATPEERAMLHSGNGQIQWLVRSTRMDLAFRLVESQARAHDSDLRVQDLLDFNKLVSDAKTDHVDITFQKIYIDDSIVVAVGDSSHGNVGKTKTASQAGLVILLADNKDDQFLRGRPAKVTPMLWRSHRIKRVVRSTLAAETMAALEAVESGDVLRQHLVEPHDGLGYWTHMDDVKATKVTDCKSLCDLLQKRGAVPSEKRLLIDIESLRNDLEFNKVVSKWVSTKQMLADCLTKHDVRAGDYMRSVLQTGEYRLTEDHMADQIIAKQRMELNGRRGEYYRSKYPKRQRPADQLFVHEGYTYFEDCIADVRYNARVVRKLLTIYAPTKAAHERYEKDFTEKHTIKKPKVTNNEDSKEELGVTEELGAHVESDENVKEDSTDVAEIYMMDAAGAESEEIKSGATAAATVTDSTTPTKKEMLKARALHERTGHSSYEKIADEFGDVIDEGVLEAYELVVTNCDECRRGKKTYASVQRGAKGSEFETHESTSKAKDKLKGKQMARDRIGECEHNVTTTQGSNQYKDKLWCLQCGMLLVDTDTTWWKREKAHREIEKTLRTSKEKEIKAEMKAIRLRDMYERMEDSKDHYAVCDYNAILAISTGVARFAATPVLLLLNWVLGPAHADACHA